MNLIDVHTHLDMLDIPPEQAIAQAEQMGVTQMISIGTEIADHERVLSLAQRFYPKVFCALGIHPHSAREWSSEVRSYLKESAKHPWVVAVGETGLDYYYENSPRAQQLKAFEEQMDLAHELKMPVQVHSRDAEEDTLAILKNFETRVTGIIHCFSGSAHFAEKALELGWSLSISGIVTFKNAQALRDIVAWVPLDRLTVETDAPFLAPVPHRGKKNQPGYTALVAQEVARIKGVDSVEVYEATRTNAQHLFAKMNAV